MTKKNGKIRLFCRGGFSSRYMILMTKKMAKFALCRGGFSSRYMIQMTKKMAKPALFVGAGLAQDI
jgi:cellobiose-specific phosphotransferase system component IIB